MKKLNIYKVLNDNRNQSRALEADILYIMLNQNNKEEQSKRIEDIKVREKSLMIILKHYNLLNWMSRK
ncbi:hypothetical protein [Clostridium sporogenes]|uniref:hypothetical protein n=1 Tax=Clostridium sporogenes TaxID=1509 RepID=UPI0022387FF5|nr:hypothetical protein [Clostridium sporogenes]MCW6080715.1 hypothetical protein [Clostridium sporogenes]